MGIWLQVQELQPRQAISMRSESSNWPWFKIWSGRSSKEPKVQEQWRRDQWCSGISPRPDVQLFFFIWIYSSSWVEQNREFISKTRIDHTHSRYLLAVFLSGINDFDRVIPRPLYILLASTSVNTIDAHHTDARLLLLCFTARTPWRIRATNYPFSFVRCIRYHQHSRCYGLPRIGIAKTFTYTVWFVLFWEIRGRIEWGTYGKGTMG